MKRIKAEVKITCKATAIVILDDTENIVEVEDVEDIQDVEEVELNNILEN